MDLDQWRRVPHGFLYCILAVTPPPHSPFSYTGWSDCISSSASVSGLGTLCSTMCGSASKRPNTTAQRKAESMPVMSITSNENTPHANALGIGMPKMLSEGASLLSK
mmetsp:Transcript_16682/g.46365  ORF Transcript_16682/g.46365 Transcript_16682/m.46365 type:complete len:107 (+) Transcript_16682:387-707(+)